MVLVDTSVWVAHFSQSVPELERLLNDGLVLTHHMILGELALGRKVQRQAVLEHMALLFQAQTVEHEECMVFVQQKTLFEKGLGWVDCHLLASTCLTHSCKLWSLDKRLHEQAKRLSIAHLVQIH
jgi:predicted nucleic acid-binding protein